MATPQPKASEILRKNAAEGKQSFSFEFFPPKTEAGMDKLLGSMADFQKQGPVFIDFTWGAGGTTSEQTPALCKKCKEMGFIVNMHLTCTNMPQGKVKEALDLCKENGITNLVALRGDPPAGQEWKASEDGFNCALDLVKYIRANYGDYFSVAVAGYPEGHPDRIDAESGKCADFDAEIAYLKEKIDAGGEYIITQLFYDTDIFLRFVQTCRANGITVPILPGMLPFTAYGGLQRMVGLCKTYLPDELKAKVEELKEQPDAFKQLGIDVTAEQCKKILASGACNHLHFYTLNNSYSTFKVMEQLGWLKQ
uniref:Methylenetetrahydrofolate reductase (NAD(P)H) n=1 Tax=Neobodo designis TaxID=312471 RepID=A0A7S1Q0V3_NEODS|mmetsp:Transcript_28173/g.87308  ORF Transcript_28173/g.87308 Transcript_28173/m.87308 type:complete len:309 (+) Transcript_28173:35-961(+)